MKKLKFLTVIFLGAFASVAMAVLADPTPADVPSMSLMSALMDLIQRWPSLKGLPLASALIMFLVQFFKSELAGGFMDKAGYYGPWARRLVITVLGLVAGVLVAVADQGMGAMDAIVYGLFSSGGAVAIYNAIKPFFKKKEVV